MGSEWLRLQQLLVVFVASGLAIPEKAPFSKAVRHVCRDDVQKFCPNMNDPVNILACLQSHEQELSTGWMHGHVVLRSLTTLPLACGSGLRHCPMYNCLDDIKQFCPDSKGTKGTLLCLWEHRSELSDKCWNQSIGSTRLGFLPESHVCKVDEHKFCSDVGSSVW